MTFSVRWPDGHIQDCYSPSLVIHDHLDAGSTYTVSDFAHRSGTALRIAGDRVRDRFGFACSSAAATTDSIARAAAAYDPDALVEVVRMHPPLPHP